MSYCRWSTDDFQCDLYCYQSTDGVETHIAGNRLHWKIELPPQVDLEFFKNGKIKRGSLKRHFHRWGKIMRLMEDKSNYERKSIGLAYDGQSFTDSTPKEWHTTLLLLKCAGYKFPFHLIDAALKGDV